MIVIETYKEEYREEIIELVLSIQQDEFNVRITVDDQPDLKNIPGYYQKENGNFWVALYNRKVIGTIGLIDIGNHESALRKMFVIKEFRGKQFGVGAQLLQTLLRWTHEKKIFTIYLGTTTEFHAAHRFYEKNGFDEIPQAALPENFPHAKVDNKFYRREGGGFRV